MEARKPAKKEERPKKKHNKRIGARGEAAAAAFLERMDYQVIERNWQCPAGEADIIAIDEGTLVFIEVKTRTNLKKGLPSDAVTPEKRKRYERIAAWYIAQCDYIDMPVRFDVIAILVVNSDRALLRHYVNAFGGSM